MMPNTKPLEITPRSDSAVRWEDVAGVDEVRAELQEVVEFLRHPDRFEKLGARVPRGVLLYGPPGTGKTLLAKAIAHESGATFYFQSASAFVEMFVGVGAARIRRLFSTARKNQPAIIFIDELDAVGGQRSGGPSSQEHNQTLNQLLVELDGFDESQRLVVIGASNRLQDLDPALLRPGRFDRHVGVALPDLRGREQILAVHTRGKPLDSSVDLHEVARRTSGLTGADLANLANEAAIFAGRVGARADHERRLRRRARPRGRGPPPAQADHRQGEARDRLPRGRPRARGPAHGRRDAAAQGHDRSPRPRARLHAQPAGGGSLPPVDRGASRLAEGDPGGPGRRAGRVRPDHQRRRQRPRSRDPDRTGDGVRVGHGGERPAPPGACRRLRALGGDEAPARRRAARDHRCGLP